MFIPVTIAIVCLVVFVLSFIAIGIFMLIFFLPYVIWRGNQNAKGKYLELSQDLSPFQELRNAFKWWKSLITKQPA